MARFNIYPKDGEKFILTFHRFELAAHGESFTLFNDDDQQTGDAFLSLDNMAAIVPEEQPQNTKCFSVHLRNKEPFPVYAEEFKENEPTVDFYAEREPPFDLRDMVSVSVPSTRSPIKNVYVALSEVIAIICVSS